MFTSKKAVRVLGFAGVATTLAFVQACTPQGTEESPVDTSQSALCLLRGGCDRQLQPLEPITCPKGQVCNGDGKTPTGPVPPVGYVVKYSTCTYYVEGEGNIRNNSRTVNVAPDGTIPIQRSEPIAQGKDNARRAIVAKLPQLKLRAKGKDRQTGAFVEVIKLGQLIVTKEPDGSLVEWTVGSEHLGEPVRSKQTGKLEYQDHCFRNPATVGKDTAGYIAPGVELAASCVVEDINQSYNALSAYGYTPLMNYATRSVPTYNNPASTQHPDGATFVGFDGTFYNYTGYGAGLNDLNGAERDAATNYFGGDNYCHMIVSGGLEVPGAKRAATRSLPFPGSVTAKTYDVWRPVNANLYIVNDELPVAPDPIEPPPEPVDTPVDSSDATTPM